MLISWIRVILLIIMIIGPARDTLHTHQDSNLSCEQSDDFPMIKMMKMIMMMMIIIISMIIDHQACCQYTSYTCRFKYEL